MFQNYLRYSNPREHEKTCKCPIHKEAFKKSCNKKKTSGTFDKDFNCLNKHELEKTIDKIGKEFKLKQQLNKHKSDKQKKKRKSSSSSSSSSSTSSSTSSSSSTTVKPKIRKVPANKNHSFNNSKNNSIHHTNRSNHSRLDVQKSLHKSQAESKHNSNRNNKQKDNSKQVESSKKDFHHVTPKLSKEIKCESVSLSSISSGFSEPKKNHHHKEDKHNHSHEHKNEKHNNIDELFEKYKPSCKNAIVLEESKGVNKSDELIDSHISNNSNWSVSGLVFNFGVEAVQKYLARQNPNKTFGGIVFDSLLERLNSTRNN